MTLPWAGRLCLRALKHFKHGHLVVNAGGQRFTFGDPTGALRAEITVRDPRVYAATLLNGEVGLGDAFVDGWWTTVDLLSTVLLFIRNMAPVDSAGGPLRALGEAFNRAKHRLRDNSVVGSRSNIAQHYDLGNAFYRLWLDKSLTYSCGVFESPDEALEVAQERKLAGVCRKLALKPGDKVLEIGSGWGSFALWAAAHHGVHVTTLTLSREQYQFVQQAVRDAGLEGQIEVRFEDYRQMHGQFDKVASIEMFEAVGLRHYDSYFGAVERLMTPQGLFLLQAITMNEASFPRYIGSTDWIQQRIFPGAELASVSEVMRSVGRVTSLGLESLEDIGLHYATTLQKWKERFLVASSQVRALGFDERFMRTWEYYLVGCQGGFLERHIGDAQMVFFKRGGGSR